MITQKHSSMGTSNPQVSRGLTGYQTYFGFPPGSTVLDYGGGRYDYGIQYMASIGCKSYVYDPFWRTPEYNKRSIEAYKKHPDFIVCANVLNVIMEDEIVESVVAKISKLARKGTIVVFKIHEGDGSGIGKLTKKGWQRNQKMMDYYPLILKYFPNAIKKYELFVAQH